MSPNNVEALWQVHDCQLRQREELLDGIRSWSFKPERKENLIQEWKEAVHYCLTELYSFREAITLIQKPTSVSAGYLPGYFSRNNFNYLSSRNHCDQLQLKLYTRIDWL
jgi:hypothetical protein